MALGTRVFKIHSVSHFSMILSLGLNHCIFSDKQWFKAIMDNGPSIHPSIRNLHQARFGSVKSDMQANFVEMDWRRQ